MWVMKCVICGEFVCMDCRANCNEEIGRDDGCLPSRCATSSYTSEICVAAAVPFMLSRWKSTAA